MSTVLDREEYIEQVYFFRVLRERAATDLASQQVLDHLHEEVLSTTRLPMAIQFLATEIKHSGLLSTGFARLGHYFTPFQTFVIKKTEDDKLRFATETALMLLEREADYRAKEPTAAGLLVYQFESICRNRLGYDEGLRAMAEEPFFNDEWRAYVEWVMRQVGVVDFADLVYLRSNLFVAEQLRRNPDYEPPLPPLFGEKEGKIARANRGRDPLYFFAALQRQLGYPEVPRPRPRDDPEAKLEALQEKFRLMEQRMRLLESEVRGQVDLNEFAKPDILSNLPEDE